MCLSGHTAPSHLARGYKAKLWNKFYKFSNMFTFFLKRTVANNLKYVIFLQIELYLTDKPKKNDKAKHQMVISIPNPPVSQLVAFVRVHAAEMFEQVVEGMSGQVQGATGLMRVKKVDDVQAEVPLEPLNVRVSTMKHLRTGKKAHSAETYLMRNRLFRGKKGFYCSDTRNIKKLGTHHVSIFSNWLIFTGSFCSSSPRTTLFHRCPAVCESWWLLRTTGHLPTSLNVFADNGVLRCLKEIQTQSFQD